MSEAVSEATVARRAEAPSGLGALLRAFVVPVFGFLCFFAVLATGIQRDRIPVLGLAIATGSLILTFVVVDRTRPRERRNLLFSIFSFAYFVFMVLPAFVFFLGDSGYQPGAASPNPILLTPPDVSRGLIAAFVAYAVLLAAFSLPLGAMAANFVPRMKREWSAEATLGVALITIPLGWAVVLGSNIGLIPERAGSGVLGTISQGTTFGIALIGLCYLRYRSRAALLLLALAIPPTMVFGFFTSSKGAFLRPLVMLAVVHVIVTRRLRLWWIAGFIALASLLYPVSMSYRTFMHVHRVSPVQVLASPQRALRLIAEVFTTAEPAAYLREGLESTAHRLDGLGILSVIVRDAGTRVPFQGGWSLSYIPVSYIPRILWPGKPKFTTGKWVTDNFGFPGIESATGCTWVGEFYFNFGWTGVVVGMILLGVWFRFLQDSFLRIDATIPAMLAGVVTILVLASALGGDLVTPTSGVVFNVAPIVLTHLLVRQLTPPPARLPPPL